MIGFRVVLLCLLFSGFVLCQRVVMAFVPNQFWSVAVRQVVVDLHDARTVRTVWARHDADAVPFTVVEGRGLRCVLLKLDRLAAMAAVKRNGELHELLQM